jgi:glycosyltransferase involved in cell wall biosynthesis
LNFFSNYRIYDACLQHLPGNDLVYERNDLFTQGAAMACKKLKIPYVIFFEADQILELDYIGKPITGILRRRTEQITRYCLQAAARIICVSNQSKEQLNEKWGVQKDKVVVLPNGVDVNRFWTNPNAKRIIKNRYRMDANPLIVFVGSFFQWHDIKTLLDAFAVCAAKFVDARLLLIGEGEQRIKMMKYAEEIGIGHLAIFTGFINHEEMPELIGAADVAVVPYPKMNHKLWLSPLKLFEYMASGVAIVASESGQVAEVIENGKNGLLVPPGDSDAMAAAITKLIIDQPLRTRLGAQARKDAIDCYSWESYVERLENLFESVVNDHSKHRVD